MKAFLTLLLFFASLLSLPCPSRAETPRQLAGFMEIPWGTDIPTATRMLKDRVKVEQDGKSSPGKLWFSGGTFAGYETNYIVLEFAEGKLVRAVAFIKWRGDNASHKDKAEFKAFKRMLTDKYGVRSEDDKQGDSWSAKWHFPSEAGREPDTIVLSSSGGDHACSLIYTTSRFKAPLQEKAGNNTGKTPGNKKDL